MPVVVHRIRHHVTASSAIWKLDKMRQILRFVIKKLLLKIQDMEEDHGRYLFQTDEEAYDETLRWRFLVSAELPFRSLKFKVLDFIDDPDPKDSILSIDFPPPPSSADNRHIKVVGSCNGLLCLAQEENRYILWNSSTGECWNDLARIFVPPKVTLSEIFIVVYRAHGFGYDSTMDDYKILRVTYSEYLATKVKINILGVRSNSWRMLELKNQIFPPRLFNTEGMFAYGSLHWVSTERTDVGMKKRILSICLVKEMFEEKIPLPKFKGRNCCKELCQLRVVGGKLSLVTIHTNRNGTADYEIWVMMKYGAKESWEKKVTISYDQTPISYSQLGPLHFLKNGKVLLALNNIVMIYDPEGKTYQKVDLRGDTKCFKFPLYIETLVSPFSVPSAKRANNTKLR